MTVRVSRSVRVRRGLTSPSTELPRTTFWQQVMVSLLLDGNAFVHVMRNPDGSVFELAVLNPKKVQPVRRADGSVEYRTEYGQRCARAG